MSKLIERLVYKQVLAHLEASDLLPKLQSGYRRFHSTETALLKVLSDIFSSVDGGNLVLLSLLDMSAAFDLVDHDILLQRLNTSYGLAGTVLEWLRSFLSDRTQLVHHEGHVSNASLVVSGVPQGSVLGPLLFLLYTADIIVIAQNHSAGVHCYADDGQLYLAGKADDCGSVILRLSACVDEIDTWAASNRLKLNTDKTQAIWIGNQKAITRMSDDPTICLGGFSTCLQGDVSDLGVTIDSRLSMKDHVGRICSVAYYQLRQLWKVKKSLSSAAIETLVHAFVTSRIDYCNSLLYGISAREIAKLQSVMRTAARLISGKRKFDSITPYMRDTLHWLPINERIHFKICLMVFRCLHGVAPTYLAEMLIPVSSVNHLSCHRSASRGKLVVPSTRTKTLGTRSFAAMGPTLWNALPDILRNPNLSLSEFKTSLKTHLFKKAYDI